MFDTNSIILAIATVIAAYFLYKMITHKRYEKLSPSTMSGKQMVTMTDGEDYDTRPNHYKPKDSPAGIVEYAGNVHNLGTENRIDLSNVCNQPCNQIGVASNLLPKDNQQGEECWDDFSLQNQSFLDPSKLIGVDTVSSSRRNANLQLRGEPVIPKQNLCPWNNSSIAPALCSKTLEIDNTPEEGCRSVGI